MARRRVSKSALAAILMSALLSSSLASDVAWAEDPRIEAKSQDSDGDGDLDQSTGKAAAALAQVAKESVEDFAKRTETSRTFVNPDGTLTDETFATAVRVKDENGAWRAVDYHLAKQSDGSFAPKATAHELIVSGGGSKQAAQVKFDDGRSIAVTWPETLPKPTITGGVATYKLSDAADLIVAVTGSGVATRLRLNKRPTVDDPVFTFGLNAEDLDIAQTDSGGLSLSEDGDQLGSTSTLVAWDARVDAAGQPSHMVPLNADLSKVATAGEATKHELALTAPQGYLDDPETKYPVTIDPDINALTFSQDTWVRTGYTSGLGGLSFLVIGKSEGAFYTGPAYSYLQWANAQIAGKTVVKATMGLHQYFAASCDPKSMGMSPVTSPWSEASTVFTNRPSYSSSTGHSVIVATNRGGAGCAEGPGVVDFDITLMAQAWGRGTYPNYGLLMTTDATNVSYEKQYCSSEPDASMDCDNASKVPALQVTYNGPPGTALMPVASSQRTHDGYTWVGLTKPTWETSAIDSENSRLRYTTEVRMTTSSSSVVSTCTSPLVNSGVTGSCASATALTPGSIYVARSRAVDAYGAVGAWSAWKLFKVNVTPQSPGTPAVTVTGDQVTLTAIVTDADGDDGRAKFVITEGSTVVYEAYSGFVANGAVTSLDIEGLKPGNYSVRAWGNDGSATSTNSSGSSMFTVASRSVGAEETTLSGSSPIGTIDAVIDARFPDGAQHALIVSNADAGIVAEGIALASALSIPLVSSDGTDSAAVITRLQQLGVVTARTYGGAVGFAPPFSTSLEAANITLDPPIASDGAVDRTAAAANLIEDPTLVVAVSEDAAATSLSLAAATAASGVRRPLIIFSEDDTDNSPIEDYFDDKPVENVVVVGARDSVPTATFESTDGYSPDLTDITGIDSNELSHNLAMFDTLQGRSTRTVFVAPTNQAASIALAGYASDGAGNVLLGSTSAATQSQSPAGKWAQKLGLGLHAVISVGDDLLPTYTSSVTSEAKLQHQEPSFRVTELTQVTDGTRAVMTPVLEATAYTAYDINGTSIDSAPSPSLLIPTEVTAAKISATKGSLVLRSVELRMNDHSATAEADTVTAVSTDGSAHSLLWADLSNVPKLVTRYMVDSYAAGDQDFGEGEEVAIVCGTSYVDRTADPTKQWIYEVSSISGVGGSACQTSGSSTPTSASLASGTAIVPPFAAPSPLARISDFGVASAKGRAAKELGSANNPGQALPSITDSQLIASDGTAGLLGKAAAADGLNPITIRYQGFIPGDKYVMSTKYIPPWHRGFANIVVNGSGRTKFSPTGKFKFRADTAFFGPSAGVKFTASAPSEVSKLWGCSIKLIVCVTLDEGTPTTAGITLLSGVEGSTWARATVDINSKIPILDTVAPAISGREVISIRPGGSSISIKHDRMPRHEIWAGPFDTAWVQLHGTSKYNDYCLLGSLPGCTVRANLAF